MRVKLVAASARLPQPAWAVVVVAAWTSLVVVALVIASATNQNVSLCLFRGVFGLPCPTCGGTRCTLSLWQGHLLSALAYNPLVAVGNVVFVAWLVGRVAFRRAIRVESTAVERTVASCVGGWVVIANWVYLVWSHSTY